MGRKKIEIKTIDDVRVRKVTFNKRKSGLIKKAMELSILCDCEIGLMIATPAPENKVFQYSSTTMPQVIQRLQQHEGPVVESRNNDDYGNLYSKKGDKGSDDDGDDDGGDDEDAIARGGFPDGADAEGKAAKPRNLSIQIPQGASGLGAGMEAGQMGQVNMGYEQQVPTPGGGLDAFPSPTQFLGVMTPNTMKEMQSFLVSPNTSGPMSLGQLPPVLEETPKNAGASSKEETCSPASKKQKVE